MKHLKALLLPTLALFLIGSIVTAALSVTNYFTKDRIALQEEQAIARSMEQLIPGARYDRLCERTDGDLLIGYNATIDGQLVGYIFRTEAMGYKSKVQVMVAFDTTGTITGVEVTDCADESPGIGQKVGIDQSFLAQFTGQSQPIEGIDAITGATYSSDAVKDAVNEAIAYMQENLFAQTPTDVKGGSAQ